MRFMNFVAMVVLALGLYACSRDVAGTATQTENTVAGNVYHVDGTPAEGAIIRMAMVYAAGAGPRVPEYVESKTNSQGRFSFQKALADTFQLVAADVSSGEIFYLQSMTVSEDTLEIHLDKGIMVKGTLLHEGEASDSPLMAYIRSVPIFEPVATNGEFSLLVPEGYRTLEFGPADSAVVERLEQSGMADSLIFREWTMPTSATKGDVLDAGSISWGSLAGDTPVSKTRARYISGEMDCSGLESCSGAKVFVSVDLFGFDYLAGDSSRYSVRSHNFFSNDGPTPDALTDSLGRWVLPAPEELPYDSFRVEYYTDNGRGASSYITERDLVGSGDTLFIGKTSLNSLTGQVRIRIRLWEDGEQVSEDDCYDKYVVMGMQGTTFFRKTGTCFDAGTLALTEGDYRLVVYIWDPERVAAWLDAGISLDSFVYSVDLGEVLASGDTELTVDYAIPSLK